MKPGEEEKCLIPFLVTSKPTRTSITFHLSNFAAEACGCPSSKLVFSSFSCTNPTVFEAGWVAGSVGLALAGKAAVEIILEIACQKERKRQRFEERRHTSPPNRNALCLRWMELASHGRNDAYLSHMPDQSALKVNTAKPVGVANRGEPMTKLDTRARDSTRLRTCCVTACRLRSVVVGHG